MNSKVIVCPRCNRAHKPGTVICECGEMLGGVEPIEEGMVSEKQREIAAKDSTAIQENAKIGVSYTPKTPLLSVVFYILAILSFLGGILMANDDSLSFIEPIYWVVAGFIEATIFLFMGRVLYYLEGIFSK